MEAGENIFGLIVLTVLLAIKHQIKGNDESLLVSKIRLVQNLKNRHLPSDQEAKVLTFIQLYTDFVNPGMQIKFDREIALIINKTTDMGIIEFAIQEAGERAKGQGIEQGIEQGRIGIIRNMLQMKNYTVKEIARITNVSLDFVATIRKKLIVAD